MHTFHRTLRITSADQVEPLLNFIHANSPSDYWELAELMGIAIIDPEGDDHTLGYFEKLVGTWRIHIEDVLDRYGRTEIRLFERIKDDIQDVSDLLSQTRAIESENAEIADTMKVVNSLWRTGQRNNDNSVFDKMDKIDPGAVAREKYDILTRRMDLLTGDLNQFIDYTGLPGVEYYDAD